MAVAMYGVLLAAALAALAQSKPVEQQTSEELIELRMPHVRPTVKDTYLCYAAPKGKDAPLYITGFDPHANMSTAHHVLLYGCAEAGGEEEVWDCGEMQGTGGGFSKGPVCKSGAQIIYAWAMDAPHLTLPKGVAFKIYGDTGINQLVIQVHYLNVDLFVPPNNGTDNSGLTLHATTVPQPKRAGVYLLGTGGKIAPHSTVYMETACSVNEPIKLHPFAYRAHAHTHGEVVSGYVVREGKWTELGRVSPKLPEMFYNVTHPGITVKEGDILAARCTMVNNEDKEIKIGETSNDEMCNFYLMYWVDGPEIMEEKYCFTPGPPTWSWGDFEGLNPMGVPSDASIVPGTKKLLKATEKLMEDAENIMKNQNELLEEEVEGFIEKLRERLGDDFYRGEEAQEEEYPQQEEGQEYGRLEEEQQLPYEIQERLAAAGYGMRGDMTEDMGRNGYNRIYGADEEIYDPRSLRDSPVEYNPWLENENENFY